MTKASLKEADAQPVATATEHIVIIQAWSTELAHKICRGCYKYALTKPYMHFTNIDQADMRNVANWDLDGLICAVFRPKSMQALNAVKKPMVLTGISSELAHIPQVDIDHYATGTMAADYLIGLGYKRFGVIAYMPLPAHQERARGFCERLNEHGYAADMHEHKSFQIKYENEQLRMWALQLDSPSAVFCTWDRMARDLVSICLEHGISVPDDVAVLGCEDDSLVCESIKPMVSSVSLPYRKAGFEAARVLDQLLQGKQPDQVQILLPPQGVEVRASTNHLAIDDDPVRRAVAYIRRHASEKVTVEDVARYAGISLRQLQRRFKDAVGHTAARELQISRVEKVKKLLIETDLPMVDIAELCGYADEFYLGKNFKKIVNCNPSEYRQQHLYR